MKKDRFKLTLSEQANLNLTKMWYVFGGSKESIINNLLEVLTPETVVLMKYLSKIEDVSPLEEIHKSLLDNYLPTNSLEKEWAFSCLQLESVYSILNNIFNQVVILLAKGNRINPNALQKIVFLFEINSSNGAIENHTQYEQMEPRIKKSIEAINNRIISYINDVFESNDPTSAILKTEHLFEKNELKLQIRNTGICSINELCMSIHHSWEILIEDSEILQCVFQLLSDFSYLILADMENNKVYNNSGLCFELLTIVLNNKLIMDD